MNTAEFPAAALQGLADIELPPPPDWQPWLLIGLVLLIAAAVFAGQRIAARRSGGRGPATTPETLRAEAREHLDSLRLDWQGGIVDDRETGYRIGAALRIGLGLPQLQSAAAPAAADPDQWRWIIDQLRDVRYRPDSPGLSPEVFVLARGWLARSSETTAAADDA